MDEGFTLLVTSKGKEYSLTAKFIRIGYIHQFHVDVEGSTLIFEFDEESNYRVIDPSANTSAMSASLIEAIVNKISSLHQ